MPARPDGRESLPHAEQRPFKQRWLVQLALVPAAYGALVIVLAGRPDWVWGWAFIAAYLTADLATLALVRDSELIAERQRAAPDAEAWDRRLMKGYGGLFTLVVFAGGLDARLGWSPPLPLAAHLLGGALVIGAAGLSIWAMRANTYFSAIVRLQRDRGQRVITGGPYRFIRHPGNLSMVIWLVGTALLLGSLIALMPAAAGSLLALYRTSREDRLLRAELPGYEEYAGRVRYRLLPALW